MGFGIENLQGGILFKKTYKAEILLPSHIFRDKMRKELFEIEFGILFKKTYKAEF